jgi:ABC-type Zn uptake system ZnuABC Zn-binding protein ZnuA
MRLRLRPFAIVAAVIGTAVALAACGSDDRSGSVPAAAGGKLAVVATTTQVADFARVVGGDRVAVTQILKSNIDPHDYEPTAADVTAIGAAKVLVKSGVGLEKWLDETVTSAGFNGATVDASTGVKIRQGEGDEEKDGDPHIWHDPRNAAIMVRNVESALAAKDPAGAVRYQANAAAYERQVSALDVQDKAKIASIPAAQRQLVTNHDAFGYYVDHYGLTFVGSVIPSFDTQAELSPSDVHDLVAKIEATGVKAVFTESSLPPKTAEAIAQEAGVKVVSGADALFGDTLGPPGSDGDTYLKMEAHNTRVIVENLR